MTSQYRPEYRPELAAASAEREVRMKINLAALAREFGADTVEREDPVRKRHANGADYMVPGRWVLTYSGQRVTSTSAQSRKLNAAAYRSGYFRISPIPAAR